MPDDQDDDGYGPCRVCVIDAGSTFVVLEPTWDEGASPGVGTP